MRTLHEVPSFNIEPPIDARPGQIAEVGDVQAFFKRGIEQQGHVTLAEPKLKKATMLALATRTELVMVGVPGTNKSEHADAIPLLIFDIDPDLVVTIPSLADLRPQDVIGGRSEMDREVTKDREITNEKIVTNKRAIVKPNSQFVKIPEATRTNPRALNAVLELIRKRVAETTGGKKIVYPDIEGVTIDFNPTEDEQATFALPDALASRNAIAVVTGRRDHETNLNVFGDGFVPKPENIQPIATRAGLHAVQGFIALERSIIISDTIAREGTDLGEKINDDLRRGFEYYEGDKRLLMQLRRNVRALAALNGRTSVNSEDLHETAEFLITGRLGMVGIRGTGTRIDEVPDIARDILNGTFSA